MVREHSALHKFTDGTVKEAFQLQEMGAMGTGSLEHGDASGDIFWMVVGSPFSSAAPALRPARVCLPRVHTALHHR